MSNSSRGGMEMGAIRACPWLLLAADASGAEWAGVGADFFEGAGEGLDVGLGEVLGEVAFDSVAVVAAGVFHRLGALVGEDDEDRASVVLGAEAGTSPASSMRSMTRVKPLLL